MISLFQVFSTPFASCFPSTHIYFFYTFKLLIFGEGREGEIYVGTFVCRVHTELHRSCDLNYGLRE